MVLYKRKPIILPDPKPLPTNLDVLVWHIDETGEWFQTYEEYLARIDFYTRHHFTCEITGSSCLTFFEALDSEESQFKCVEEKFPLKLREPVARFLHFNTIRRLDALVEKVYSKFKNDFFPGESVYLRKAKENSPFVQDPHTPSINKAKENLGTASSESDLSSYQTLQKPCIIKEKVQFNPVIDPVTKKVLVPGYSKYMLVEDENYRQSANTIRPFQTNNSMKSFIADESQIYRDRSTFTKHLIKCFFKITLQRASTKMGAPWCVKPEYLQMYGLTMDWPTELLMYKEYEPVQDKQQPSVDKQQEEFNNHMNTINFKKGIDTTNNGNAPRMIPMPLPTAGTNTTVSTPMSTPTPNIINMNNGFNNEDTHSHAKNTSYNNIEFRDPALVSSSSYYNDKTKTIISYDDSDPNNQKSKMGKKRKNKYIDLSNEEQQQLITDEESSISKTNKRRRRNGDMNIETVTESELDSRASSTIPETTTPIVLRSIVNDMDIPYKAKPTHFISELSFYNKSLECLPVISESSLNKQSFGKFDRVLQIYQFLSTFNKTLCLSYFNFDQFVTSLKCSDPFESQGELVHVTLSNHDSNETQEESQWKRNPVIRNMIKKKNNNDQNLKYRIIKDEPASDDKIDDINGNGTGLLIEIFVALLRLFIDEKGEWKIVIMEEWLTAPITLKEQELGVTPKGIHDNEQVKNQEKESIKTEDTQLQKETNPTTTIPLSNDTNLATTVNNSQDGDDKTKIKEETVKEVEPESIGDADSSEADEEFENLIDRCLNYRNQEWTERLTKRQFNNSNWLIILLGIFEDNVSVSKYSEFITYFKKNVITKDISMNQLPKFLWRNFCRNLTLEDKVSCLWILMDIVSNFSPDIKGAIENSMEKCMHIRSDRFKIFKDIKAETTALNQIDKAKEPVLYEEKEVNLQKLQDEKTQMDKKLMENDYQRLKPLGMDRYCNRYFWFDLTGMPNRTFSEEEKEYHGGRLWVRGPNIHCLRKFLKLKDEDVEKWLEISKSKDNVIATRDVFGVYRREDGAYMYIDPITHEESELLSADGQLTKTSNLTPIQRKIIDETPQCLLLDRDNWYCIQDIEYIESFIEWLDIWGRKEHDLLRQFKPILNRIKDTISIRNHNRPNGLSEKELTYIKELEDYTLSEKEINVDQEDDKEDRINVSTEEKDQDDELDDIETKLEKIVDEIMNLDDGSKTRKVLNAIAELENKRDFLLEKKEKIISQRGPSQRILARTEKTKIKNTRDNKLSRQEDILSSLINHKHYKDAQSTNNWKNEMALEDYGAELRKNATKGKKHNKHK